MVCRVVFACGATMSGAAEPGVFEFHHDNILGTSLDLQVRTPDPAQATLIETTVLAEIERLRKILSSYDESSELSRVNASTTPEHPAPRN